MWHIPWARLIVLLVTVCFFWPVTWPVWYPTWIGLRPINCWQNLVTALLRHDHRCRDLMSRDVSSVDGTCTVINEKSPYIETDRHNWFILRLVDNFRLHSIWACHNTTVDFRNCLSTFVNSVLFDRWMQAHRWIKCQDWKLLWFTIAKTANTAVLQNSASQVLYLPNYKESSDGRHWQDMGPHDFQ